MSTTSTGTDTIIIGAGAAGLAMSACRKQEGVPNIILERSDKMGAGSASIPASRHTE